MAVPDRRAPSPAAQQRRDTQWKARVGLTVVFLLLLFAAVLVARFVRDARAGAPPMMGLATMGQTRQQLLESG